VYLESFPTSTLRLRFDTKQLESWAKPKLCVPLQIKHFSTKDSTMANILGFEFERSIIDHELKPFYNLS